MWLGSPRGLSVFVSLELESRELAILPGTFYVGSGRLNSNAQAYRANTIPTEPSLWPSEYFKGD